MEKDSLRCGKRKRWGGLSIGDSKTVIRNLWAPFQGCWFPHGVYEDQRHLAAQADQFKNHGPLCSSPHFSHYQGSLFCFPLHNVVTRPCQSAASCALRVRLCISQSAHLTFYEMLEKSVHAQQLLSPASRGLGVTAAAP